AIFVHGHAEFGGEDDVFSARAEDLAHHGFGDAVAAVDVGGVEESDAGVEGFVDDFAGTVEIDVPAEIIAAEADEGNLQAGFSEIAFFHFAAFVSRRAVIAGESYFSIESTRSRRPAPS